MLGEPKGNILADEMIRLPGSGKSRRDMRLLGRVVVWDAVGQREIVRRTNNLKLPASTIAAIYKQRWRIELFFKALKQNFRIKTFVGTMADAVRIQISNMGRERILTLERHSSVPDGPQRMEPTE